MSTLARVRQINAVLSAIMTVLFVLHGVGNAFGLLGVGMPTAKALARAVLTLAIVHAAFGVVLTVATLRAQHEAGVVYPASNVRFWAVRVSGLAVAVCIAFHMIIFLQTRGGAYRLREFAEPQLAASIGLVAFLLVHLVCNARPLAVSLGLGAPRARAVDLALVFVVLLAIIAVAFVAYYQRWSVV